MKKIEYKKSTIGKHFFVKNLCKVTVALLTFFGLISMIKLNTNVYAGTATSFNWNNNQFLTGGFWSQNPTNEQIINALFGANSAYTMNRPSQNCNTGNITVSRISDSSLTNNLTQNKIYILQSSGVTISSAITIPKCTAIVSSVNGGTTIYSNGQLDNHMFKIQGSQLRNIIIDNINFEGQYSKAGAHHTANTNCIYIYGNTETINSLANVTINNSTISRCTNGVNIDGNGFIGDTQYITLNNLKFINNQNGGILMKNGKNILINNIIGKKGDTQLLDITTSNYITINNSNSISTYYTDIAIDNQSTGIVLNNVVGNIHTATNGCLAHNIYGNITSNAPNTIKCKVAGYHRYFSQDSCVTQATSISNASSNIWNQVGIETEEGCINWNYMAVPERNGIDPLYLFTSELQYITTNCNGQSVSCRKLKPMPNYDAVSNEYKFSFGANVPTQEIVARWNGTTLTKASSFPINTSNYIGSDVKKVNHSTTLPQYVTGSTSFSATSTDTLVSKYSVLGPWITTQRYGITKGTNTTVTWSGGDGEKAVLIQLTGANYFATHFIAQSEKTSGGPSFTAGTLLINECSTTSQWQAFKNYNTTNPSSLPFKTSTITGYTDWFHNNGYVSYTAGQPRTIYETLTARDSAGNESTRTATITINNVAPTANNFTVSVGGCGPITKNRKTESSATEGNCGNGALTATIVQQGTKGTCSISSNNIIYTANQGANGSDNCSVRITDNEGSYKEITVYWTNISCGNINGLTGTLIIENGAEATNHSTVALNITRGSSEISKMRFSCDNSTWSNWESFNTTKSWTFSSSYGCSATQGNKTVYVMFSGNNKTGLASDSIIYDTTKPTVSVSLNSAGGTIQIIDSLAGLSGNQLIYYKWQTGTTCPTSISNYSPLSISYQHGDTSASRVISASGLSGNYYLCVYSGFYDRAGNSSDLTRSSNSQSYHSNNGDCYISTQPTLTPIGPNNKTQTGIFSIVCLYPLSASKITCRPDQITGRQNYFCGGGQNRNCQSEFESCLSSCNEGDKPCELACKEAFTLCEESSTQTTDCNLFNVGCNGNPTLSSQIELTYYYKINPNRLNDITSISYGLNFPLTLRNNVLWNNTPTSDLDTNPIKFDFIGPVTMIISPNNGSTQSGDFVVNMTNTDNRDMDGNISTCYYNIKSGNTIVGSGHGTDVCNTGFIVSIDQCNSSTCTVEARGVDDLGNTGNIATYTYNISFGTPVLSTPEIYNGRHIDVNGTEYYKGSIRVKSYITQGRNISSCQFSADNGSHRSAGTLSTDEIGQFCYKELNTTNNINIKFRAYNGSYGTSSMLPAIYDNVAPTLSEKTEFNGWYTSSQRSYFYFTDTGVGISGENSEYCTISSEGENQTCSLGHINIQDRLGNIVNYENTSNGANIDYSAPTVTATRDNRACTNNVNITLNATDAISGLPAQPFYFEGSRIGNNVFSINTPGTYNRTIRDIAGNETSYSTGISNIDSIAPVIQITNGIGYECETITGNISATDEGCGNSSITYSWNNSDFGSNTQYGLYSQEASIEGIDTYIPVSAKDGAGNTSSDSVQFIWQDRAISGNSSLNIGTIKAATGITNIITKFNITGYGSCETITMTTGSCTNATQSWNGTTLTITPSENTSANGSCTVYFTDGDTTLTGTITFTVNTMKPVISITGPASGWAQSKTVKATATNSPTTFKYAITNNSTCNSSISFTNTYTAGSNIDFLSESDNGKYVCFMATNAAGTTYKSSNQITQIDTTKPVCGTPTYTPNSYTNGSVLASIPATDTGAGLEIPSPQTINFTTNGEQSVTYADNAGNSQTCTASVSRIDKTNPTSTLTSSSTLKATSQRLTGTCSDTNGIVAYYFGTSTTPSYTDITSTPSFTTGKNITSAGTYYLYCKDAAGNISSGSKVFYTYTVYNMQETCAGSTTAYNTSNYTTTSSGTYIAPSGTTLTLASIYTAPTGTTFKGMNAAAPSSSTATLSNTAPTLSANSTYSMWFSRNTNTLTLTKNAGVSTIYYKVNGANSYSSITSSTTKSVKYGCSAACYGEASNGYTMETYPSSNPWSTTSMTSDQTCAPTATANTYSVTYNKGTSTAGSITVDGTTIQYANLPKVQNRTYPNASTLGTNNLTKSNTDIVTYTVTLSGHGGTPAATSKTTTRYTGYTANGWTTTQGSTTRDYANGASFGASSTSNLTLYPCFTQTATTPSITLPGATRAGYTFMGWSTASNDTGVEYASGASYTPTGDTTLYAVWKKTITITFNVNGNGGSNSTKTCEMWNNDTSCSITSPSITCSTNTPNTIGWSTAAGTHSNSWTGGTAKSVSANSTYYAQCSKTVSPTAKFYKNGATSQTFAGGSANSADYVSTGCSYTVYNGGTAGSCSVMSPSVITRANFTIVGYNTSDSATSSTWNTGVSKSISSDVTYYAITYRDVTATYKSGVGVSSIGENSTGCRIQNSATSCSRTLTTITCNTSAGYTTPKWNGSLTPGASVSLTANTTYTGTCSDTTKPVGSLSTTSTTNATSQRLTGTCTDGVGVTKVYMGTKSSPTASDYVTVTSATSYTTGMDISASGTYYLFCKDAADNTSDSKSQVYVKYQVKNMLDKVTGTTGTYTTNNYDVNSTKPTTSTYYVIPNGTSLTLANLCTSPSSTWSTYKGASVGNPGTSAASFVTSANAANQTYACWYDRKVYNLTLKKGTGISAINNGGTSTENAKGYKYGASVAIDATVNAAAGYTWGTWSKTSGTNPSTFTEGTKSQTIVMGAGDVTLTANANDTTKPVGSLSTTSTTNATVQRLTGTCTDGVGVTKVYMGTKSSPTASDYVTVTSATSYTTGMDISASGTYYLFCKDATDNTSDSKSQVYVKYQVKNMLDTIDGTTGTYTTANYAVDTTKPSTSTYYVIPNGTSLTLANLCTAPSTPSNRKITSVGNPGTSAATNTASANASNTTYACWYDRETRTLTLKKGTGISSVTNGGTATESAKTYKYGKQVSISATANTSAGYSFSSWTKDSGNAPANANSASTTVTLTQNTQLTANANDTTKPVCSISTTSTEKSTSQTATLSCTDGVGVTKYYWGTSASPSDSAYTTVTSTTSFSTTKTVSAAGTYYLIAKDAAGNTSTSVNKVYNTYSVQNVLDKVSGTQGTYTTSHYETTGSAMGTYIIPNGTTITLNSNSSYGDPISSHDTYKGYSTTALSSSAVSLTTSNPSISANTTYYRFFDRDSHTLTLNKGTGISSVSGGGTYKHGKPVSISATANTSAGYSFASWTRNSGDTPASTSSASTTVTITQDTNLTANASDTTAPTPTLSSTATLKATSQTATLKCSDGVGVTAYYWGTTEPTSAASITTTTSLSTLVSSAGLSQTINAAGTYWLACKDSAGNYNKTGITIYSYEVHNMLNAIDKSEGTYNTTNYPQSSIYTYIAPANTTITFANVYSVPTYSAAGQYKGYTTSNSGTPSTTTSQSLSTNKTYYFWFSRSKYNLILTINTGISTIYYKVDGASSYSSTTTSTTKSMKAGSTAYAYATSSTGYTCPTNTCYTSSSQWTASAVTSDKTFNPIPTINSYTLTINPNGGTYNGTTNNTTITQNFETQYTMLYPTKTGYTFSSWIGNTAINWTRSSFGIYNNKSNGTVTHSLIDDPTSPTNGKVMQIVTSGVATPGAGGFYQSVTSQANHVYYQVYRAKIPTGYKLTWVGNSCGEGKTVEYLTSQNGIGDWATYVIKMTAGSTGSFSTFGHIYITGPDNTNVTRYVASAQIYDATAGVIKADFQQKYNFTTATNQTLTAQWTPNTYYITYNNNGGAGSMSNTTCTYDSGCTLRSNSFTKTGYTFKGWSTNSSATTAIYTNGQSVSNLTTTNGGTVTLYAVWKDETKPVCTVTTQPSKSPISTVAGYNTGTITFTCTDDVGITTTSLTSGAVTLSNSYVTLSNATVGGTSTSKTFTFTYTAKSNVNGNVTLKLAAGKVSDAAGNTNDTSSVSNIVVVDTTKPTITLTSNTATCKTGGITYTITGTFSENVNGVETGDLTLTNANVISFTKVSNTVYKWTVKASTTGNGTAKASIAASKATDGAGNNNTASNELTWTYDNDGPTFTFSNNSGNECTAGNLSITSASDAGCAGLASSAYKFGNGSWGTTTSYSITAQQPGTITVTGYVRDALGNQTVKTATYTFNNVVPTANNFSTGNIGKTAKSITLAQFISASNASEGSCGTSALNFSGVKTNGTKGSCSISSNTLTYTPNTNKTGSDTCVITIKDNENSTKDITVTFNDIDTVAPTCSITEAACTSGALRLTLTANETINTPSGWTKTNGTTYYKDVTANTQITANISDTAGNVGNCSITPTHYDVNGPTFTFANKTVNECTAGSLSITSVAQVGCAAVHTNPYSFDNSIWNSTSTWTFSTSTSQPGSGNKTAYVRDALGNVTSHTATWTISNVAPTANNFTLNSNVGNAAKTGNWKTLSSATEGDCGNGDLTANVKTNGNKGNCSINGDVITYTPSANKTGSDSCIITIKDNENSTKDITVSVDGVDTVAPTCSISQSPAAGTWTNGNVTLTATVTDTNKDKYSWTGFTNMVTSLTTWTMTANGSKTMYVQDKAGNTGSCSITVSNIDKTKPTVSANNNGTSWKSGDIVITLSAGDTGGAGLEYSKYSWTSASDCTSNGTSFSNGGTITDSTEGNRTLYLCVKDKAGNTATWSGTYKLDKTNPICGTWTYSPALTTRTNGNVTATLASSTDAIAGINVSGGNCTINSYNGTCNITISDNVGRTTVCTSTGATNIDKSAPTVSANNNSNSWKTNDTTITLSATDNGNAGLEYSKYSWTSASNCTSAGTSFSNGGTITNSTEGNRTLYLCAKDKAGNTATWSGTYKLDKTAPSIDMTNSSNDWKDGDISIKLTSSDATSGLSGSKYYWTGNSSATLAQCRSNGTSYTSGSSITDSTEGTRYLYICAYDNAGNSSVKSGTYKLDKTNPTFTLTSPTNLYECTTGTATISSANDTGAGLASSPYSWNGGSYGSSTSYKLYKATTGSQNIAVKVKDALGHETTNTATYTWLDSKPTANNFTITGTVTGTTINRKTKSNAQEGSCGNGNLTANITNSSNGTCTINGNNLTFKTNTGILTGNGTCTIRIKDDENSTKDITVTFENIYNPNPSIKFTGITPSENSTVNNNRFTTQMIISGLDTIKNFRYNFNGKEYDLMSGLVLMYNFDNISSIGESSTIVKDLSNNGNDGTINGATFVNNGVHGGAYSFNGTTNNYIDIPNYGPLNTNGAISLRVKGNNKAYGILIGNQSGLAIGFNSVGNLIGGTNGMSKPMGTMTGYNTTGWNHIVVSIFNGTISYYVNGIKLVNGENNNWSWSAGSGRIGMRNNTSNPYPFKGQIDEVRVYNRALSLDEIQLLYKSNLKKTSNSTWEFESINTCLADSGTYSYSGSVSSTTNITTGINRTNYTDIVNVGVNGTGFDFGSHSVTGNQRILTGTMGTLTVTDYIGATGSNWKVYLTTSPTLIGKDTNQTIDTNNLKFKANSLGFNSLYNGITNSHVSFGAGISTTTWKTAKGNGSGDKILEYITRTPNPDDFLCEEVGTYTDNTLIELDVPAWQIQDTYEGTLWITLQE